MDPYLLFFDSKIAGGEIEDLEPLTIYDFYNYLLGNLWSNAGIVAMAVAFKLFQISYSTSIKLQDLKQDQLNTELAYLKTQVNPHFLFNTLNNMYVMSKKKSERLPDTIMQLSDLLRYQLYDTEADTVPLNNEITYLKNYLKLEQLRREHLKLVFDISGHTGTQKIRPLILLPYIENAFKYSNSGTGSDYIKIQLHAEEKKIKFSVENSKGTLHRRAVGGIGMTNARRRLELGYPNKHSLDIQETDKTFIVALTLDTV
jgi:LytS/YehU family sensor histidine kinase